MAIDLPTRRRDGAGQHRIRRRGHRRSAIDGVRQPLHHLPTMALAGVAIVWGVTFSVVDSAVPGTSGGSMPPADLVAWRFGLGAVALLIFRRRRRRLPSVLRRRGVVLGVALGSGFLLQTWAMTYTDATMSAFLTGMLVVIAPAAGWLLFRDRPLPMTLPAVAVAAAGLAALSLRGAGFGPGELLTLAAACCWAVHLVLLARWAEPAFAIELAALQTGTVCALALVAVAVRGVVTGSSPVPELPADGATWLSVLFLALLATAGAMVLLSWGQARMSATRAAVILTLEPAIAALTAAALGGESLGGASLGGEFGLRTVVGGLLLLGAMFLVELGGRRDRRTELRVSRSGPEC